QTLDHGGEIIGRHLGRTVRSMPPRGGTLFDQHLGTVLVSNKDFHPGASKIKSGNKSGIHGVILVSVTDGAPRAYAVVSMAAQRGRGVRWCRRVVRSVPSARPDRGVWSRGCRRAGRDDRRPGFRCVT